MASTNPDLIQMQNETGSFVVPPLTTLTPPQPTTLVANERYFTCSLKTGSLHRKDGKRMPFVNGFYKTKIKEDIEYLEDEIRNSNIYIRACTPDEVEAARMMENPMAVIREKVEADVLNELTIESLERLLASKRSGELIAGVDPKRKDTAGTSDPSIRITPMSTRDISAAMAGSMSESAESRAK